MPAKLLLPTASAAAVLSLAALAGCGPRVEPPPPLMVPPPMSDAGQPPELMGAPPAACTEAPCPPEWSQQGYVPPPAAPPAYAQGPGAGPTVLPPRVVAATPVPNPGQPGALPPPAPGQERPSGDYALNKMGPDKGGERRFGPLTAETRLAQAPRPRAPERAPPPMRAEAPSWTYDQGSASYPDEPGHGGSNYAPDGRPYAAPYDGSPYGAPPSPPHGQALQGYPAPAPYPAPQPYAPQPYRPQGGYPAPVPYRGPAPYAGPSMAPVPNPGDRRGYPSDLAPQRQAERAEGTGPRVTGRVRGAPAEESGRPAQVAAAAGATAASTAAPAPAAPARQAEQDRARPAREKAAPPAKPQPPATREARLAALADALKNELTQEARLEAPTRWRRGETQDVRLRLPDEFAETVAREAAEAGLTEAARGAGLAVRLEGSGVKIDPDDPQIVDLTPGAPPPELSWRVTPGDERPGALTASLEARLRGTGGAETLSLGTVSQEDSAREARGIAPRTLGALLVILFIGLLLVWLAGRKPRPRTAAAPAAAPH